MSDFLDRLERQLVERARQDVARPRRTRWSRRTLVLAALAAMALVAVPAAAVTGVFSRGHERHGLPAGPGLVDLSEPCIQKNPPQGKLTTDPPPQELLQTLGVFRRPQVPADRVPTDRLELFTADGVNPDYVRHVTSSSGLNAYLIPANNINFRPAASGKGAGCKALAGPKIAPMPGVCMRVASGGTCSGLDGIREGKSLLTAGGSGHGKTLAAGIVPDGVKAVIWRVRRGNGFLDTRVPVRDNVYIGRFPGRHGHGLYVFFVDAKGKHLVIGPHHLTARERAQARRGAALDRAAGPTPTISPAVGRPRTLFMLRMRVVKPRARYLYAVTVTGRQPGDCGKPYRYRIGMLAGVKGPDRGLMRAAFGPPPDARWCVGTYRGTVRRQRGYSREARGPVVGRFSFDVR